MKKSDLKTGMTIQFRIGWKYRVLKNVETEEYGLQDILFASITGNNFDIGDIIDENLDSKGVTYNPREYDIIKVWGKNRDARILSKDESDFGGLIWERKDDDFVTLTTEDGRKIKISKKSLEELKKL